MVMNFCTVGRCFEDGYENYTVARDDMWTAIRIDDEYLYDPEYCSSFVVPSELSKLGVASLPYHSEFSPRKKRNSDDNKSTDCETIAIKELMA